MKTYSLTLRVLLDSCINKFSALVRLYRKRFSSLNKDFKTVVIKVPVFSFRGTLQAKRENISITFKGYLYLLYFEMNLNLQDPFPRNHQYLLPYTGF